MADQTVQLDPHEVEVQGAAPQAAPSLSPDEVEIQGAPTTQAADKSPAPVSSAESQAPAAAPSQGTQSPQSHALTAGQASLFDGAGTDGITGPPASAAKPGAVPPPDMREKGVLAALTHAPDLDPSEVEIQAGKAAGALAATPGGRAIGKVAATLASGPVTAYGGAKSLDEGLATKLGFGDQSAAAKQDSTGKIVRGATGLVGGGGQMMATAAAPGLLETGIAADAGSAIAKLGLVKFIAGVEAGNISGAVAQKALQKLGFSQDWQELAATVFQIFPSMAGEIAGVHAEAGRVGRDGQGVGVQALGGRVKAGVASTPEGVGAGVKVGDTGVYVGPQPKPGLQTVDGAGKPAPEAPQTPAGAAAVGAVRQSQTETVIGALARRGAQKAVAKNVVAGVPPPQKPMPAGMENGELRPAVLADAAKIVQMSPPEKRAGMFMEAHSQLADWMAKRGKVVLPDGKLQVIDSPKKAEAVAADVLNKEVERHDQAHQEALDAAQTQQEDAAKQAEEEKQAAVEQQQSGELPPQVQRAKTLLEANPDHPNPTTLVQRNLKVGYGKAQELIAQAREAQQPQVGGQGHQVTEEGRATVDAQLDALTKGTVPVVMLPEGSSYQPKLPDGMKQMDVKGDLPGAGSYIYDPKKIRPATIREAAKAGTHGDLLGHVSTKEEVAASSKPVVVTARAPHGPVIQDSAVDGSVPGNVGRQAEQLRERHPEASIEVRTPEQAQNERAAERRVGEEESVTTPTEKEDTERKPEPVKGRETAPESDEERFRRDYDANPQRYEDAIRHIPEGGRIPSREELRDKYQQSYRDGYKQMLGDFAADLSEGTGWAHTYGRETAPAANEEAALQAALDNAKSLRAEDAATVNDLLARIDGTPGQYKAGDKLEGDDHFAVKETIGDAQRAARRAASDQEQAVIQRVEKDFDQMPPDKVLPAPKKQFYAAKQAGTEKLTVEEAKARVESWKAEAKRIGREEDHSNEVVLSLFDRTGHWSQPYRDAGYDVRTYDIESGDDLVRFLPIQDISEILETGKTIIGVLAAPPCTSFAVSGARWWKDQHDAPDEQRLAEKYGLWATTYFDTPLEYAKTLVASTQVVIEFANPTQFHVLENPIGRIAEQNGMPKPLLTFDPHNYGDPYTKRTQLWGNFSAELPTANVDPTEGSKIHKLRGDNLEDKLARSETPEGFAYAFFMANHKPAVAKAAAANSEKSEKSEVSAPPAKPAAEKHPAMRHVSEGGQRTGYAALPGEEQDYYVNGPGGKPVAVKGKPVSIPALPDHEFFIHASLDKGAGYTVTERSSGMAGITSKIPENAIADSRKKIAEYRDKVLAQIKKVKPEFQKKLPKSGDLIVRDLRSGETTTIPAPPVKIPPSAAKERNEDGRAMPGNKGHQAQNADLITRAAAAARKAGNEFAARQFDRMDPKTATVSDLDSARVMLEDLGEKSDYAPVSGLSTYEAEVSKFAGDPNARTERVQAENRRHAEQLLAEKFPGEQIGSAGRAEVAAPNKAELGGNKAAAPSQGTNPETPYKPKKGETGVRFLDRDGVERTGTVAHAGAVVRFKGEDGKEYNVPFKKVLGPAAAEAQNGAAPASEPAEAPPVELHPDEIEEAQDGSTDTHTASLDQAGGGRPAADTRGTDREGLGAAPTDLVQAPKSSGDAETGDSANSTSVRGSTAPVPKSRPEPGSGQGSDSGLDHTPGGSVAAAATKALAKPKVLNRDWYAHPDAWRPPSGTVGRLEANLKAIRILRDVEKTPRKLTDEERDALANYVGWGALQHAFAPWNAPYSDQARWKTANAELMKLLSPDEMARAQESTKNAHYTSPELVRFMWDTMRRFGFKAGNVLEPSVGTGNFLGMMPKSIRGKVNAIVNEMDSVSHAIAKLLYPEATHFNKDFADLILPDNDVDLAIGNPPFGGYKLYDPAYKKLNALVHDFFFVKSLDKVRPGGVLAFITSTGTMDKADAGIRNLLASKADFLGAVRLPSGAFKANAGTDVTTDLIFLQKRAPNQEAKHRAAWLNSSETLVPTPVGDEMESLNVNEYFQQHPEMMLGRPTASGKMYGGMGFVLQQHADQNITDLLKSAQEKLPRGIFNEDGQQATGSSLALTAAEFAPDNIKEGQFTLDKNGQLKQSIHGKLVTPEAILDKAGKPQLAKIQRLKALVGVRDKMLALHTAMLTLPGDEDGNAQVAKLRTALQKEYDKFVAKFGFLNGSANNLMRDDRHYSRLLSLENWDKAARQGTPADIFQRRTVFPPEELRHLPADTKDAFQLVLAQRGYPDMTLMARLRNEPVANLTKTLIGQGLIYRNPQTGAYETRETYLSGYVRDKLAAAKTAVEQGLSEYAPNVAALEKVVPPDIEIGSDPATSVAVRLGSTWIPTKAIEHFIRDTFRSPGSVLYVSGVWKVKDVRPTAEVSGVYGTPRADADWLLEQALNLKQTTIKGRDADGKEYVDKDATIAAQAAQEKIRQAFQQWAVESKWKPELQRLYNDAYNNLAQVEFDGSHLTFPGMNPAIKLNPHQVNAIWRILQEGRALLAHEVGAGKTFEMAAAIMEGRRVGTFKKPMLTVPNHIVEQFRQEFLHLYPGANLLVPSESEFDAKNRQRVMSRIATGDYDAIILPHSQFNLMDISPERQRITIQKQKDELRETIESLKSEKGEKRTIKQLETAMAKLDASLKKLSDLKADKAIYFDHTGVDALFVDEAHTFKNLSFYTKMTRVAGLQQAKAKSALRLKMKTEYLQDRNNGRGVIFATGTPVQNTMAELYTMFKYVAPDVLERAGIRFFDDWAANFGNVITAMELSADGRSYKPRAKFAQFQNVPELMNMFRSFADIKTAQDLNLPTPELDTGKPIVVSVPASDWLDDYVKSLMDRAEDVKSGTVDPTKDNMLKITTDGRKAATDKRLIDHTLPDDAGSKINTAIDTMYQEWLDGREGIPGEGPLAQMAFLDLYRSVEGKDTALDTGKKGKGPERELINLYKDMRNKLVGLGVPREQIAIIGEHDTRIRRQALFAKVNRGEVRILLGSTQKMGAGTNAQRLLKALHHIDLTWRPGDLAQRVGRILRQGNLNKRVRVYTYLTERSFDAYMAQTLQGKAEFIAQLFSGRNKNRVMADAANEMVLSLEEMKIAASGNPDVKKQYDLQMRKSQLESLQRSFESGRRSMMQQASTATSQARAYETKVRVLSAAIATIKGIEGDGEEKALKVELDGKTFTDRKTLTEYVEAMEVPPGNFYFRYNGISVDVSHGFTNSFGAGGSVVKTPNLEYHPEYGDISFTAPQPTIASLIRSLEARLRNLPDDLEAAKPRVPELREKAKRLAEASESKDFPESAELAQVEKELRAVQVRLGIKSDAENALGEAVAAEVEDEPEEEDEGDEEEESEDAGDPDTDLQPEPKAKPQPEEEEDHPGSMRALLAKSEADPSWANVRSSDWDGHAARAKFEVVRGKGQYDTPALRIDANAWWLLHTTSGLRHAGNWLGVAITGDDARTVAKGLKERLGSYEHDPYDYMPQIEGLRPLVAAVEQQLASHDVLIFTRNNLGLAEEDVLREERMHVWQDAHGINLSEPVRSALLNGPHGERAQQWMVKSGYPNQPNVLADELGAKAAAGAHYLTGLTPKQLAEVSRNHFTAVARHHGTEPLRRLPSIHPAHRLIAEGVLRGQKAAGAGNDSAAGGAGDRLQTVKAGLRGATRASQEPGNGVELRASAFGLDLLGEFMAKQGGAFWKSDVAPALEKLGESGKAAGKQLANVFYPRLGANKDALDAMMTAKGRREQSRFELEHIHGGLEKFFDKMERDEQVAFIDRYKLGQGQSDPKLQQVEDLMRSIDDAGIKEAQRYKPTLTAKENHFRVIWKVIPNLSAPGPVPAANVKGAHAGKGKRPFEGDRGFMKRSTLDTISEGINYGGVPVSYNPWKLFTQAQASMMQYISAQEYWAKLKGLGLRKFVRKGQRPPEGWTKIPDRIAQVYYRAEVLDTDLDSLPSWQKGKGKQAFEVVAKDDIDTHTTALNTGEWYVEPSAARLLINYLSEDHIRKSAVGNAMMVLKNGTTAIELGLSPFHLIFESVEAIGSQLGVGLERAWNIGVRRGDPAQMAKGMKDVATAFAAPFTMARTGGSLVRAASDLKGFAATPRGAAFLKQYNATDVMARYFEGGGQFNMNPDYRIDPVKSLTEAAKEGNYIGAALRLLPAAESWLMKPLFDVYIPRLKMGLFAMQYAEQVQEFDKELAAGDLTEAEVARNVVDTVENRFGELNFSNLFWNNTFKSAMQFFFRSVTWKLGNWRGAGSAAGPEAFHAFADPLKAMWEDAKQGKKTHPAGDYAPRLGINQAWILSMALTTAALGSVAAKLLSGKYPWEWIADDKREGYSLPGALLLECMHPRTGKLDPHTGAPDRLTVPTGIKDFEHAARDLPGYLKGSLSEVAGRTVDISRNRDFFGNYVYDPQAEWYQKAAQAVRYVVPKPIALSAYQDKYGAQDTTSKVERTLGFTGASKDLDMTPAERAMRAYYRDQHQPLTPDQVKAKEQAKVSHHMTPTQLRRALREKNMDYAEKLFQSLPYSKARDIYDRFATSHERAILRPMLEKKRSNLLRRGGTVAAGAP